MKSAIMVNWFLNDPWGWRRYLADCLINTIHTPARTLWWAVYGGIGIALGIKSSQITEIPQWILIIFSNLIIFLVLWLINLFWILIVHPLPLCQNGCCRKMTDYTWAWGFVFGKEGWRRYRYWCKCGDQYIRKGSILYYVTANGNYQPYMKRIGYHKWIEIADKGTCNLKTVSSFPNAPSPAEVK
jgi:hypothetical protein